MAEHDERRSAFEARLAELKRRMEAGLLARAHTLRQAAARLVAGDATARRVLKQESHKLRGVAGSYGYDDLTALAAELESRASLSPPAQLEELATRLADAAAAVSERSTAAVSGAAPELNRVPTHPQRVSAAPPTRPHSRTGAARPNMLGSHGGALRVLAMDDDATTLRLLHLTLSEVGGFDPVLVTSGRDALSQLCIREFDVVISDAMMPDMNGREFCAAARELGGYAATVPIIILSAATQDELRWRSVLPGPVVWLRKPFIPSALVQDIAKVVKEHRG
jgi:CheY-like chemotaxis protein/HPt (histidine-containing phosphotransfer) domain-containing protein